MGLDEIEKPLKPPGRCGLRRIAGLVALVLPLSLVQNAQKFFGGQRMHKHHPAMRTTKHRTFVLDHQKICEVPAYMTVCITGFGHAV